MVKTLKYCETALRITKDIKGKYQQKKTAELPMWLSCSCYTIQTVIIFKIFVIPGVPKEDFQKALVIIT